MNVGGQIYSRLTGYSGVSDLVGSRVYPLVLPQVPTLPAVAYQQVSDGTNRGTTEVHGQWYQFGCHAETYAGAVALADEVEAAFNLWAGVGVKVAYRIGRDDMYDVETDTYRVVVDIRFAVCD
jgi:hypothetical protein